jgi:intermediate peptidase
MLSKTDYQHIAGTRVATDFVEVPSTLMEYFAKSPLGLSYMVPDMKLNSNTLESLTRSQQTSHIDNAHQLQLSIIDQLYHGDLSASTLVPKSGLDTTNIYKQVINNSKLMTFIDGTRWQCQFTHLYSYGASYYSYIWSRILAKRIWDKLFRDNQGDIDKIRRGGDALRRELLEHGGGRDPWEGLDSIGVLLPKERERRCLENE